jgi:hypothetical protein
MEVILVSTPGDCAKIALWNMFARSRKARDSTIATSGRSKSVQGKSAAIGICAPES